MSGWSRFQSQFYETEYERRQRFQKQKAKLTSEGKCWQCATKIEACQCLNVHHECKPVFVANEAIPDGEVWAVHNGKVVGKITA